MRLGWIALALLAACSSAPESVDYANPKLAGRVLDGGTNLPLEGVNVTLVPGGESTTTNAQGQYTIATGLDFGRVYRVHFARPGYVAVNIDEVVLSEVDLAVQDVVLQRTGALLRVDPAEIRLGALSDQAALRLTDLGARSTVLSWSATTASAWLSVSLSSGDITGTDTVVLVEVDRSQLAGAYGDHEGAVVVTSNGGTVNVPVFVSHPDPVDQQLRVDTTPIGFGATVTSRALVLENLGDAGVNWELVSFPSFLIPQATAGEIGGRDAVNVSFRIDRSTLEVGDYNGDIVIGSDSVGTSEFTVPVTAAVLARGVPSFSEPLVIVGGDDDAVQVSLSNSGTLAVDYVIDCPRPTLPPVTVHDDDADSCWGRLAAAHGCDAPGWVSVNGNTSGTLAVGGTVTVDIGIDRGCILAGTYVEPLHFVFDDGQGVTEQDLHLVVEVSPRRNAVLTGLTGPFTEPEQPGAFSVVNVAARDYGSICEVIANDPVDFRLTADVDWLDLGQVAGSVVPSIGSGHLDGAFYCDDENQNQERIDVNIDWNALVGAQGDNVGVVSLWVDDAVVDTLEYRANVPATVFRPTHRGPFNGSNIVHDPFADRFLVAGPERTAVGEAGVWEYFGHDDQVEFDDRTRLVNDWARGETWALTPGRNDTSAYTAHRWGDGEWQEISVSGAPDAVIQALVYDPRRDRILAYTVDDELLRFDAGAFALLRSGVRGGAGDPDYMGAGTLLGGGVFYAHNTDRLMFVGGDFSDPSCGPTEFVDGVPTCTGGLQQTERQTVDWTYALDLDDYAIERLQTPLGDARSAMDIAYNPRRGVTLLEGGQTHFYNMAFGRWEFLPRERLTCNASGCSGGNLGAIDAQLAPQPPNDGVPIYDFVRDRFLIVNALDPMWEMAFLRGEPGPVNLAVGALDFGQVSSGEAASATLTLRNDGFAPTVFRLVGDTPGLTVDPRSGDIAAFSNVNIAVHLDTTALPLGVQDVDLRVVAGGGHEFIGGGDVEVLP